MIHGDIIFQRSVDLSSLDARRYCYCADHAIANSHAANGHVMLMTIVDDDAGVWRHV